MMHSYLKRPLAVVDRPWTITALCAAYAMPRDLAAGGVIAIIELGGGWLSADVTAAFNAMGLPAPDITDVSVDGTRNSPGADADAEVALDIQVAGGVYAYCTGHAAEIRMYWGSDFVACIQRAVADGCDVFSISWGADEAEWGNAALDQLEAAAEAATAAGMTIFAASGDNDSGDGGPTPANVDAPSSSPHIVGCGGTSKPQDGSETVWNNNPGQTSGEGTGGGYSTHFAVQPWQVGTPPAPNGLGRMVPDVAAAADPNTGYEIVIRGQTSVVGGTSAVAPLWSGFVAALGRRHGFISPKLYSDPAAFNSPIDGDNGAYKQPPCPGPCTGLGSPIGPKIAALLTGRKGNMPCPFLGAPTPEEAVKILKKGTASPWNDGAAWKHLVGELQKVTPQAPTTHPVPKPPTTHPVPKPSVP